jgi:hypothetical protein
VNQYRLRHGSVQGVVWLSSEWGVAQHRVRHGLVDGCGFGKLRMRHISAPDYIIKAISNFFKNSRRYSQLKVHHRCHWQKGKIFNQKSFHSFFSTPLGSRVSI